MKLIRVSLVLILALIITQSQSVNTQHIHRIVRYPAVIQPQPPPVPPVPAGVLSVTDLKYRCAFYVPGISGADVGRYAFTQGALSGRRVSGVFHLFLAGRNNASYPDGPDGVGEISIPGCGQRASTIHWFGDVTKGRRILKTPNPAPIRGIYWNESAQRLLSAYGSIYNASSADWDPSIFSSNLGTDFATTTAAGPWRTSLHSQKTRGYMGMLPGGLFNDSVARLYVGSPQTSSNAQSPFGAFAAFFTQPSDSLPASVTSNTAAAITTTPGIYTDINNRQLTPGVYKTTGWVHYNDYATAPPQNNPVQNGSGCNVYGTDCGAFITGQSSVFSEIDMFSASVYVQTPNKKAIIYIGQVVDTIPGVPYADGFAHKWYGPTQVQSGPGIGAYDPYGHLDPERYNAGSTGDATDSMLSVVAVYNPVTAVNAFQSGNLANAIAANVPLQIVGLNTLAYVSSPFPAITPALTAFGGAVYDDVAGLIYVSLIVGDVQFNENLPIILVFEVNQN